MIATELRAAAAVNVPATLERLVLTGFMGAGKSSVGRLLAEALGWELLDLDAHIEAREGAAIAALFAVHGEAKFRRLESAALANALVRTRTVLALGGGTPERVANRLQLEQTPGTVTVFLDAPFEVLYDRCMLQSIEQAEMVRPLLTTPDEARARFVARLPLYRRMARVRVETGGATPAEVVAEVLRFISK